MRWLYYGGGGGYNQNNQQQGGPCAEQPATGRTDLVSALSAYINEMCEIPPDSWDVHLVTDFSTGREEGEAASETGRRRRRRRKKGASTAGTESVGGDLRI